jgi:neutral ceramidase
MENVMLSATHTHSGPGGYLQYALYLLAGSGFVRESFGNLVDGIVSVSPGLGRMRMNRIKFELEFQSIQKAHENMVPAQIYLSSGELLNASINRSPSAYQNNPPEERAKYTYDTDKLMTQLKFVAKDGTPLGLINWFAVHLTSMNKGNRLISSDNKGYAALLFENLMNPDELVGQVRLFEC